MSTKLNVEELAENRYPVSYDEPSWDDFQKQIAYAAAIREVAQPIADERDELLDMLYEAAGYADEVTDSEGAADFAKRARAVLAKYTKP